MFFAIVTLITALSMATVAAWFAVAGIMAVFAGAPIPALIMGAVIELGKVVGVSWIYQNWKEKTSIKYTMLPAVFVAMMLTSMGIFGFLSKAHLEQNAPVGNNTAQIERLDQRIGREQKRIDDAETVVGQLDETVQTLIDFNRISHPETGARAVRAGQQDQRDALADTIDEAEDAIGEYQDQKLILTSELRELELEVGPVKYIAELIYEDGETNLEKAVRLVIIAFIFVFDPMAILLLMAANYSIMQIRGKALFAPDHPDGPHDDDDGGDDPGDDDPGARLLNIIDVEHHDVEPEPIPDPPVKKAKAEPEPVKTETASVPGPDREWIRNLPKKDEHVDHDTLISTIQELRKRDRTADEQKVLERFRKLATARNIPWDVAKRATVSTRNDILQK